MLVRFYAVAREIAGVDELPLEVSNLPELSGQLGARFGERMTRLVDAASFLHNGARYRAEDPLPLSGDDVVDLLPPFAGG